MGEHVKRPRLPQRSAWCFFIPRVSILAFNLTTFIFMLGTTALSGYSDPFFCTAVGIALIVDATEVLGLIFKHGTTRRLSGCCIILLEILINILLVVGVFWTLGYLYKPRSPDAKSVESTDELPFPFNGPMASWMFAIILW
jgi:hypothetical protein